jgi:ribosomal protein S18 acetylase RimI-like enzyme
MARRLSCYWRSFLTACRKNWKRKFGGAVSVATCDNGLQLPFRYLAADGPLRVAAIDADSKLWAVAHDLSLCLQTTLSESGLAGPVGEPTVPADQQDLPDVDAWLWIEDCVAVGFLSIRPQCCAFWLDEVENQKNAAPIDCNGHYAILGAWVAPKYEGRGLAGKIAVAAASRYGIDPSHFLHSRPFSPAGKHFAMKLSRGRIRV